MFVKYFFPQRLFTDSSFNTFLFKQRYLDDMASQSPPATETVPQLLEEGMSGIIIGYTEEDGKWFSYNGMTAEIAGPINAQGQYPVKIYPDSTTIKTGSIYPENFERKVFFEDDEQEDEPDCNCCENVYCDICLEPSPDFDIDEIQCIIAEQHPGYFSYMESLFNSEEVRYAELEEKYAALEAKKAAIAEELRALRSIHTQQDALKASSIPFNYAVTPSVASAHAPASTGVKDV